MTLQDSISPRHFVLGGGGPVVGPSEDDGMVGPSGHQGDIHGLPAYLRSGLIAIAFFGFLSLVSATGLFAYISYRLLRWHYFFKYQKQRRRSLSALESHCSSNGGGGTGTGGRRPTQSDIPDYTLGLPQLNSPSAAAHYVGFHPPRDSQAQTLTQTETRTQSRSRSRSRSPSPCPSFSDYHNQYQQHLDAAASADRDGKGKRRSHHPLKFGHRRHASGFSTKTTATTASSLAAEVATNPFLLLIYNLLLADIIQAASFLLSASWLRYDATYSNSVTCWLQGWLAMTGKLAASACLVFASGLTYLTVVRGYRASPRALYASIAAVWIFTYVIGGAGVAITHNGRGGGGWFTWSNGWCWISPTFRGQRFWLGYFWIFLSVGLTILIYGATFVTMLRRKRLSWRHMPESDLESSDQRSQRSQLSQSPYQQRRPSRPHRGKRPRPVPSGHHPAFLVYPFIYLLVTGPLATGRMLTMAGYDVSMKFYLFAGVLSAAHGFLNVALWSVCILFMDEKEQEELGLDRFMRTPKERTYGNMVWIQGGNGPIVGDGRGGGIGSGGRRRGSWAQRFFGGGGGGDGGGDGDGQTLWRNQTTAQVRPWGGAGLGIDDGSQNSLNRQTTGPSERGRRQSRGFRDANSHDRHH
ncbi:uncharacterized protein PG986_002612 [Apiospora aurea]|uniref:Glucose receptor Git3 N-terminal domain-containing protein n=1 Tax=Apiospora aurea TaxID=335848 RepID=A0ABR1QPC6_9PEZI